MDSRIASRTARVRTLAARRPARIVVAAFLLLLLAAALFASRANLFASSFAPAPVPRPAATDWSALSLDVRTVAPATALATSEARPAELEVTMTERERSMLLASVKSGEPEGLPSPQGYTPGIVVLVPGGANSDGICR